jgi:site-specific DNA-methyltransferase (adenine-specific)
VLDPFVGSGTTLAVAKMLGREGVGIEINAEYCEIAESRVSAILEPPKQLALFS